MIDVIVLNARGVRVDSAECDTPEEALVAARTLLDEAAPRVFGVGRPTATFLHDGVAVRTGLTRIELAHG